MNKQRKKSRIFYTIASYKAVAFYTIVSYIYLASLVAKGRESGRDFLQI
ncbi:hypothetical protein [Desulfurobacterium sp.]